MEENFGIETVQLGQLGGAEKQIPEGIGAGPGQAEGIRRMGAGGLQRFQRGGEIPEDVLLGAGRGRKLAELFEGLLRILERGKGRGDILQGIQRRFTARFLPLDLLPAGGRLRGISGLAPEDMGMAADHLATDGGDHILDGELPAGSGDGGMENNLEQQISQLLGEMIGILLIDGTDGLPGLLRQIGTERLMGLFTVPGAAGGSTEGFHDPEQIRKNEAIPLQKGGRRNKQGGHMIIAGLAIQLEKGQGPGRIGRRQDIHRVLILIKIGKENLHIPGQGGLIQLTDEQGDIRIHRG
jgi:hypothetical protein